MPPDSDGADATPDGGAATHAAVSSVRNSSATAGV